MAKSYNPYVRTSRSFTVLALAFIAVAALALYQYVAMPASAADGVTADSNSRSVVDKKAMAVLDKIEKLKLDPAVFRNKAFQSLQDFTVPLPPQEVGRSNPFAPLGGYVAPAAPTRRR